MQAVQRRNSQLVNNGVVSEHTGSRQATQWGTLLARQGQTNVISPHCTTAQAQCNRTRKHDAAQQSITAEQHRAQHSTAQHSTAQHSTAQHSTAQHSTAQHSNKPAVLKHNKQAMHQRTWSVQVKGSPATGEAASGFVGWGPA